MGKPRRRVCRSGWRLCIRWTIGARGFHIFGGIFGCGPWAVLRVELVVKKAPLDANTVRGFDVGAEVEAIDIELVTLPRLILGSVGYPESKGTVMLRADERSESELDRTRGRGQWR